MSQTEGDSLAAGVQSLRLQGASSPVADSGSDGNVPPMDIARTSSISSNLSANQAFRPQPPPPHSMMMMMPPPGFPYGFRPGPPPPGFPPGPPPPGGVSGMPTPPGFMRPPMMGPNGQWISPPPGMMPPPPGMIGRPPIMPGPPPPWMMARPPPPMFPPPHGPPIGRPESLDGASGNDSKRNSEILSVHSNEGGNNEDFMAKRNSSSVSLQGYESTNSDTGSLVDGSHGMMRPPPPPMMFGHNPNMPLMMPPMGFNPPFTPGLIRPPGPPAPLGLTAGPPGPPIGGGMILPPNMNGSISQRPFSMDGSVVGAPHMERTDSDNSSIHSTGTGAGSHRTVNNGGTTAYTESLEMYRQNAKKSNDPGTQLDFAKFLIATADGAMDSDPDPKKAKKNQDILYAEALKWLKKLAASVSSRGSAYPEAMFFLAECYGNGSLNLPVDHDRAFTLYVQASKQNHPSATYRAAVCYEVGAGTKRDYARSVQFYRKSAALGDTAAMYKLGMILLNGLLNQPRNPREGITWLKRAGSQADETTPHALHELAALYEGKGDTNGIVIPDPAYAHDLYRRGAQLGYSPCQYKLGVCYEYGLLDLPIDPRRSIAWYTRAAEQGDPEAELALSGWYLTGADGVLRQSDTEAYLWARKAADKGLAKAEYAVGYYSEHGVGVKPDVEEARKWYMRAAAQNNKRAVQRLKELRGVSGVAQEKGRSGNWRKEGKGAGADSDCSVM